MNDVYATTSVLASTVFGALTGIQTDGYMGVAVALFIIYSGIRLIKETTNPLLGNAPDEALVQIIEDKIKSYEGVIGLHDLVIHNYGPERCFASVHVEVCANRDILDSHEMIDRIEKDFNTQLKIHLVIHMDPVITDDERINSLKEKVAEIVHSIDPVLSMHDFRVVFGKSISNLIFDITVPPAYKVSDVVLSDRINRMVRELDHGYNAVITLDRSYISNTPGD
jgi:divalent metal cation (Fe/Co/Zn/Cd) transporter